MLKPKYKSLGSNIYFKIMKNSWLGLGYSMQGAKSKIGHEKNARSEAIIIIGLPHQGQGKDARGIKLLKV